MDWSDLELVWRNTVPSEDVIAEVRRDIRTELYGLGKPSSLVFHTVFLTDDFEEGPCVVISGFSDRDDAFDAGYYP